MRRSTGWRVGLLFVFLIGTGLGLVYAWRISPLPITDADPSALRADFKDQYRSGIAAAYAATGNLPGARARLALLKDPDTIGALNAQAQRMRAQGDPFQAADQVAALALALQEAGTAADPTAFPITQAVSNVEVVSTSTLPPPPPDVPILLTDTPAALPLEEIPSAVTDTPRPTQTPAPTRGAPFVLTGQDEVCDPNLPDGLLQVIVVNSSRRQLPGMEIVVSWEGGEEQFFTGLKPELGNGYADFRMTSGVAYTLQLSAGSDIATGLTAPTCQLQTGETFFGGLKLTFQQP